MFPRRCATRSYFYVLVVSEWSSKASIASWLAIEAPASSGPRCFLPQTLVIAAVGHGVHPRLGIHVHVIPDKLAKPSPAPLGYSAPAGSLVSEVHKTTL